MRSVAFDGTRVLWAVCTSSGTNCIVRKWENGKIMLPSSGTVGVDNVLGDATAMFWSETLPKRYVH